MKSNNALVGISLMFLVLAVVASVFIWGRTPIAAKVAMFAFGYGAGIAIGTLIARRNK